MVIEEHAKLEITLPDGRFFVIPECDIIQNSLSVTSQCVSGNVFAFGCVSPAQLSVKIRIKDNTIGRYDVYGSEIILYSWFGNITPEDGGKRGIFNVISVTKSNDIFTISASDNICWLDGSAFEDNGSNMGNAIYNMLNNGFRNAGDALTMIVRDFLKLPFNTSLLYRSDIPNSSADFNSYDIPEYVGDIDLQHNIIRLVLLLSDEQSDNVRDYVAWLAEYMGGFVCTNNNGEIQFCLFENAWNHEPEVLDFSEFEQNTLEIAGFRIYLYSAKLITEDKTWRNCDMGGKIEETGVINVEIIIENNPFIEYIYTSSRESQNGDMFPIVAALKYYQKHIQIRPFSGTYHGSHYLHLGQYIKIRDAQGIEHETTITNLTWKFRGGQQIKCIGEDSRTLSQARKRSQAVRMGERMKTQINRLETSLRNEMSSNETATDTKLGDQWNTIQDQIGELWAALNGGGE